jgi:hypothetical protein
MDTKETLEKALDLIEKFNFRCRECDNAKQSALVAVNEIINWGIDTGRYTEDEVAGTYWDEVRQEIEKL